MESTLATILVTVAGTVAVICLGLMVWAIAQLKRRVSRTEVLCSGYEGQFQGIFNEMDLRRRDQDDQFKSTRNDLQSSIDEIWRKIDETQSETSRMVERTHHRIDRDRENDERNLDKRFDSVYRKLYSLASNSKMPVSLPEEKN